MNMVRRAAFPYVLFAAASVVLGLALATVADQLHAPPAIRWLTAPAAVAISLLIALRFGCLNYRALFVTSCALFVGVELAILGILELIARQTPDGHVDVQQFIAMLGWQQIALSLAATIGTPLLVLLFVRRPGLARASA